MSALGVQPLVSELVIGHKQTGIIAVYDVHSYENEKREALQRWSDDLMRIVQARGTDPTASQVQGPRLSAVTA